MGTKKKKKSLKSDGRLKCFVYLSLCLFAVLSAALSRSYQEASTTAQQATRHHHLVEVGRSACSQFEGPRDARTMMVSDRPMIRTFPTPQLIEPAWTSEPFLGSFSPQTPLNPCATTVHDEDGDAACGLNASALTTSPLVLTSAATKLAADRHGPAAPGNERWSGRAAAATSRSRLSAIYPATAS